MTAVAPIRFTESPGWSENWARVRADLAEKVAIERTRVRLRLLRAVEEGCRRADAMQRLEAQLRAQR